MKNLKGQIKNRFIILRFENIEYCGILLSRDSFVLKSRSSFVLIFTKENLWHEIAFFSFE